MNRDFEKEYIELAQNEIPDLWDRIEAGLSEKSVPETEKTNNPKNIIYWKRYVGLAAAVLCAAVVFPAFVLTRRMGSSAPVDTSAPSETCETTEEACGEAEEACEAAEETYDNVAGYAETSDTASESTFDTAAALGAESGMAADVANDDTEGSTERASEIKEAEMENASAKTQAASGAIEDLKDNRKMQILSNIVVQVAETEGAGNKQEESSLEGMLYTVIISQDPSGTFSEGEQIEIYVPYVFSMTMSAGKEFEIDLICEGDGVYPFVVGQVYVK